MKSISEKVLAADATQILPAESLFEFISSEESQIKMNENQCDFLLTYIQKNDQRSTETCQKQKDNSYKIAPPQTKAVVK